MSFPHYIAKRYLFSKTSNNAINIITIIASFGVIIGSLALFIILSGFSGLRTFSYNLLDVSDPDIKITTSIGKSFLVAEDLQQTLNVNASSSSTPTAFITVTVNVVVSTQGPFDEVSVTSYSPSVW